MPLTVYDFAAMTLATAVPWPSVSMGLLSLE